ncbi:MAG: DNA polymerase, partial [Bradyrhizobium sp.]
MPKAPEKAAATSPAAPVPAAAKGAAKGAVKGDHVFLVDGSSYIFRAYHALPPLNRKSDGLNVNAVLGFCNMLWKLLRDMPETDRPTHLAIVFDKSEVTFRNKIYGDYKAHRPPAPDDLIPQFALIRKAVHAFDLPCLEQGGFEADDLIATYARLACERGATTTIVSSDKDLMQLVNDCVTMYDTMKDRRIGIAEVIEKFGVPPEKVVEVQALAGDSTDNVPGVPGIGIKTAAQLITDYGDLEALLSRATEIKQPKRREALIENAEKARISRQLVLLDDKVALEVPLDDLAVHEPDPRKLIAFLKAMEFTTLTRRVAEYSQIDPADVSADEHLKSGAGAPPTPAGEVGSLGSASARQSDPGGGVPGASAPTPPSPASGGGRRGGDARTDKSAMSKGTPVSLAEARAEAAKSARIDRDKYQTLRSLPELNAWLARIHDFGRVTIEVKASSIDPMQASLCGIALALASNDACYIPLAHRQAGDGGGLFDAGLAPDQIKQGDALAALKPILESAGLLKIGFNIKFTAVMLAQAGITLANTDDVQLMSYALDAGRGSQKLDSLAEHVLGHAMISEGDLIGSGRNKLTFEQVAIDRATAHSAEAADVVHRLWRVLKPRLVTDRMTAVYETLERPLVSVLARMERRGISIDRQVLSRLSGDFAQTAARVEAELQELAGEPINVGSPKQIGDILFGKMGIPGGTKTKTGAWSTSASILDDLAEQGHDFARKILEWRQVSKLKSTYTDALPTYVHPQTHRVHTTYALAATTTGRLSSNE